MPLGAGVLLSPEAPRRVLGVSDRLQVLGVDAAPISAKMIELESLGDWPYVHLVREAMGVEESPWGAAYAKLTVATRTPSADPLPAAIRNARDLRLESVLDRLHASLS